MTTKKTNKASVTGQEPLFYKWQLMSSKKLNVNSDVLDALLCEDKRYTLTQTEELIKEFMKRKV